MKPLRRQSKKRAAQNRIYAKRRKVFLAEHQWCESPRLTDVTCSLLSSEVHHMMGRGIHFLSEEHWLAVCHSCHQWIEDHKKEARALGLIRYT